MLTPTTPAHKWPVNRRLDEFLLIEFVPFQQKAQRGPEQLADMCAADWNAVLASVGSFAYEYTTL